MRILTMILLLGIPVSSVAGQDTKKRAVFLEAIERAKQYVVPIICSVLNNDGSIFLTSIEGTGFFVSDDGRLLTAGHVADGLFSKRVLPACPHPAIYIAFDGWNASNVDMDIRVFPITRCEVDKEIDVGICTLGQNPFTTAYLKTKPLIAELEASVQPDGTPVAFTGFPLNVIRPITSQGIIGTYQSPTALGPKDIVIDKNAWPGASGSPVYTAEGKVIGIMLERGAETATGLAFARSSRFIFDFLEKHPLNKQN